MSSADVAVISRGPQAYQLSRAAIEQLEARQVPPTPLNYELWLHLLADPEGELAREVTRVLSESEVFNETLSDQLAIRFLPRHRASSEIRSAGDELARQLEAIGRAVQAAQKSTGGYSETLKAALSQLELPPDARDVARLVAQLSEATQLVKRENNGLERRLSESTQEIHRLHDHLEQVRRDSLTDGLTGLPNRKAFEQALACACGENGSVEEPILTVAIVDIDKFKRFNDTWGHQIGDQVLCYVAATLGRTATSRRMAARHGGEEFAILFPGETASQAAAALDAMLIEVAARTLKRRSTQEDLGTVTVSAGYAQRRPDEPGHGLLERADAALYTSKREGRNRITSADGPGAPTVAPQAVVAVQAERRRDREMRTPSVVWT